MGRGDGSGRVVSAEGADDSGTGILHVDMDAFYASVEQLDDPSLIGKAIIVGAPDGRSVVSSASYEARRFGVRSAMPVGQALRLCPTAVVVRPHFERYLAVSSQVMRIFRDITPLVEPLSIDEAFLDVRGARRLWGSPGHIALMLRQRVRDETGLTCSVGVAATKHVAKMASTLSKPDGMLIVAAADTEAFLAPRSVRALWGVGPKASEALEGRGIRTIADVLDAPREVLDRALGPAMGDRVWHLARGIDAREVDTERVEKSVGHEETFDQDIGDAVVLAVADPRGAHGRRSADRGCRARAVRVGGTRASGAAHRRARREAPSRRGGGAHAVGRRRGLAAHRGRPGRGDGEVRPRSRHARDAAGLAGRRIRADEPSGAAFRPRLTRGRLGSVTHRPCGDDCACGPAPASVEPCPTSHSNSAGSPRPSA